MLRDRELSIAEQCDFIERLVGRCVMHDGALAGETTLTLTAQEAHDLHHMEMRLRRLAPYERKIREIVTGR